MSNPGNRPNGSNFAGYPSVDDATLVALILGLPLGDTFRAELIDIAATLKPKKFGQLKKSLRDRLMKLAIDSKSLQRLAPDAKKGIHISMSVGYEERRVKGTELAEAIVAWQNPATGTMPVPPRMRRVG